MPPVRAPGGLCGQGGRARPLFSELGPTTLTTTVALLQTMKPGALLPDAGGLRVEVLVIDCEAFEENSHRTEKE